MNFHNVTCVAQPGQGTSTCPSHRAQLPDTVKGPARKQRGTAALEHEYVRVLLLEHPLNGLQISAFNA